MSLKISIVSPSFNQGEFIEDMILSFINQDYQNKELIIIDGGSTDSTIEIINKYQSYITYWASEKDDGQSNAINKGLKQITGDIFNWLNTDDILLPGALSEIAKSFECNEEVDILCGFCDYFHGNVDNVIYSNRTRIYRTIEETIIKKCINQPSMFYRSSILKSLNGLNDNLSCVMDLDLFYRYLLKNGLENIRMSEKTFTKFRIHDSSKTNTLEDIFLREESQLIYFILKKMNINFLIYEYYKKSIKESIDFEIKINILNVKRFKLMLFERDFISYFKSGNENLTKLAFWSLLFNAKNVYSLLYLRILYNLYMIRSK